MQHGQTQQQEERSAKLSPSSRGEGPFLPAIASSEVEKIFLGWSAGVISANNIVGQEDINNFDQDINNFQRQCSQYQRQDNHHGRRDADSPAVGVTNVHLGGRRY